MSTKTIDVTHLAQAWVHSHEEDTATSTAYRPSSFHFPRSRGRKGFQLKSDGTLIARKPGPADQTEIAVGTWVLNGQQLELHPDTEGAQVLVVESVTPDRLVVSKASACRTA